jgi:2,4-dienoyl-CoA reductase-like NADH-dependent reductase (Old Yellow Enzyme family)
MSDPVASPPATDPIPNPPAGDPIFTPLKFRNLEVKNRIFRSSISGRWDNEDGSLSQTRINWEAKFARGGVGAIISSFVPVLLEGRIAANYGTVHRDDFIPMWEVVGKDRSV